MVTTMEISDDVLKMLIRLDNVGVIMSNAIDRQRETDQRTSYYDGYAAGVRDAASKIRAAVEAECPEFHERLIALGK
jgi:hypothetical protein